jgi:DNA-binding NarL/FixJ family response regulator
MCEAIQKLLAPEYDVVGQAADGRALVRMALELKPDVVLVDLGLPVLNGLDAGRQLKKLMPELKLIYLTMNPDPDIKSEAFRLGASAFLLKSSMGDELLRVIHGVTAVTVARRDER